MIDINGVLAAHENQVRSTQIVCVIRDKEIMLEGQLTTLLSLGTPTVEICTANSRSDSWKVSDDFPKNFVDAVVNLVDGKSREFATVYRLMWSLPGITWKIVD